jgi:hypothetical protein
MGLVDHRVLAQLHDPQAAHEWSSILRSLKTEIVGHDQRKQVWIEHGIIPALSQVLSCRKDAGNESTTKGESGVSDDNACLQATVITGCLAQGIGCSAVLKT